MQALILAGGSGTRFWPLSRRHRPKQLLRLDGERSLLQATVDRLSPLIEPGDVWVCTTELLAGAVREQLPEVPVAQVLCEPEGRNTAPAIGWSLSVMRRSGRDDIVAVLPADHLFADAATLRRQLAAAAERAKDGDRVMTLGVEPRWPETGYGYLELGEKLEGGEDGAREVARFREKPDLETAKAYVEGGRHLWNAGIFVFPGATLLAHLARYEPEIGRGLERIAEEPEKLAAHYAELPSISIDYAVMERLEGIGTLPLGGGWSDLGSWEALAEIRSKDGNGNATEGDVLAIDSRDNLLYAEEGTVAVVGVKGLVVVRTGDAVLVMPRERSQDVREIVKALKENRRDDRL